MEQESWLLSNWQWGGWGKEMVREVFVTMGIRRGGGKSSPFQDQVVEVMKFFGDYVKWEGVTRTQFSSHMGRRGEFFW